MTETSVRMEEHAGDLLKTTYVCVPSISLALLVQNVRVTIIVLLLLYLISQFPLIPSVLPLEVRCSSALLGQLLTVRCSANKPLAMTTCSLDGNHIVPCTYV